MTKSANRSRKKRHNRQEKTKSNVTFFKLKAFATLYTAGVGIIAEKSRFCKSSEIQGLAILFLFRL